VRHFYLGLASLSLSLSLSLALFLSLLVSRVAANRRGKGDDRWVSCDDRKQGMGEGCLGGKLAKSVGFLHMQTT
jgi:hypothetical protein